MIVQLTPAETLAAIEVGLMRLAYVNAHGIEQYWGRKDRLHEKPFDQIYGACGESAVAKLLGIPWPRRSVADDFYGAGDVGGIIEVRTRRIPGSGPELGIRPIDEKNAHKPFVLAHFCTRDCSIDLRGWDFGYEGPKHGVWNEPSGCWFLPPEYRPIEDLITRYGRQGAA